VDLSGYDFANATDALALASQVGADTVFDFGGGDTLTLSAVTLSSLAADDFFLG
jgi:hypothetical protein